VTARPFVRIRIEDQPPFRFGSRMRTPIGLSRALLLILALACSGVRGADTTTESRKEVLNFALLDQRGRMHELRRMQGHAVVLFFTANGCPVARQYASTLNTLRDTYVQRGVDVFMVNASTGDNRASIAKEMKERSTIGRSRARRNPRPRSVISKPRSRIFSRVAPSRRPRRSRAAVQFRSMVVKARTPRRFPTRSTSRRFSRKTA
jgi:hypothetical protein